MYSIYIVVRSLRCLTIWKKKSLLISLYFLFREMKYPKKVKKVYCSPAQDGWNKLVSLGCPPPLFFFFLTAPRPEIIISRYDPSASISFIDLDRGSTSTAIFWGCKAIGYFLGKTKIISPNHWLLYRFFIQRRDIQ